MTKETTVQSQKLQLLKKNLRKNETPIALLLMSGLSFLNVIVTHLFNGSDEYFMLAAMSIISFIIEIVAFSLIIYCAATFKGKKFKSNMKRLIYSIAVALSFTAFVKLLIVIFF